jgi:hypothetical protein
LNTKQFIIIIGVVVAGIAAGLGVYVYTNQLNIEAQNSISYTEQCMARVQSFVLMAQDAFHSGKLTYEQWRAIFDPEAEQLNRECPSEMREFP